MKLVKRESLAYREGTSDKVYEVDLCEVTSGKYVVNFRYGRRGSTLKEGSKTSAGVDLAKAEAVFADLVGSKVKKGYARDDGAPRETKKRGAGGRREVDPEARKAAILSRLADAAAGRGSTRWPVERAIWRAGELGLREAAPSMAKLTGTGAPLRDYCVAWALGRCGDPASIDTLVTLLDDSKPEHVRRMAREAALALSTDDDRAQARETLRTRLSPSFDVTTLDEDSGRFASALATYLATDQPERVKVLETLYLIDDEVVRPAVLATLRTVPLEPPWFRVLRHIFKAAEFRRDAEVFGILSMRFEKSPQMYSDLYNYPGVHVVSIRPDGAWLNVKKYEALARDDSEIAYGFRTRRYLRKRVARTLRRLGELGDENYVKMAVGVLLQYSDADAQPSRRTSIYDYNTRSFAHSDWIPFAPYLPFNTILYANSPRYEPSRTGRAWRTRPGVTIDGPEPEAREEAFPELWDQRPAGLVHLLAESECEPVHRFAVKALRANAATLDRLDTETIVMLLGRPYEVTARLAFDLAVRLYVPQVPDLVLVAAVADCAMEEARQRAREWIDADRARFFGSTEFVTSLVLATHADTRAYVRDVVKATPLSDAVASDVASRVVEFVLARGELQGDAARDAGAFLLEALGKAVRSLDMAIVTRMLEHPLVEVQEIGARILLIHETPAESLPDELLRALVNSPNPGTRSLGVALVGKLADSVLVSRDDLLLWLTIHPHEDVRDASRALLQRLATGYSAEDLNLIRESLPPVTSPDLVAAKTAFVERFSRRLVELLLDPEPVEGSHAHLLSVLADDLHARLAGYTLDDAWRYLAAEPPAAQELAGRLFAAHPEWAGSLSTEAIVDLASHEIRAVREAATALFPGLLHRFQRVFSNDSAAELFLLIRVLDSQWDDMRAFWHSMFRVYFRNDYTVGHLVAICDSPRADARALGRELVGEHANPDDGLEFLTKLSEHPAADMQLFVTGYLEGYAAGSPERLADLAFYFTSVLSRVNSSRGAKRRVLAFLAAEAVKDEASARVVASVLARVSATASVEYRAAAIETMLAIHGTYPQIALPIHVRPVEVRHAL